jgi:ubiquinone/menaquinone biosynthesis C-methylase UbiE
MRLDGETSAKTASAREYHEKRRMHWDMVACKKDSWQSKGAFYHKRLGEIYNHLVQPGQRVLDIGCGTGELLASFKPSVGVGVDLSGEMIKRASLKYPDLRFIQTDVHELSLNETFDIIIMSDIVNDLWDVQSTFMMLGRVSETKTRIIINTYSLVWQLPLMLSQALGLTTPLLPQNWLTVNDIQNMLYLTGFEVIRNWPEILWPIDTPGLSTLLNKYASKLLPFSLFSLTNFIIARKRPSEVEKQAKPVVSVIIPARNETGNVEEIIRRTPEMGAGTELLFVEGNSSDNTYETIEKAITAHPERKCRLFKQTGKGKGDAVRLGFLKASGDILMILDADMTVPPEDLPRFYKAIVSGEGEFINGVRLVYPMEKQAMRYFNLVGNKFFSLAFSWLLGQPIKDTLCGTKVLSMKDYRMIAQNRLYFGDFDPFGDFDLLFGAAKLNMKIVEIPIRYAERKYGDTNIQRWKHGLMLLKMVIFASRRIKFV